MNAKNVFYGVLSGALTFGALSLSVPRLIVRADVPPAPRMGRYAITPLGSGQFALLLDTATGAVWQYSFGDYCQSKTPPNDMRQIRVGEQCKDGEDSFDNVPAFERVSVEGLHKTWLQQMIDSSFQRQVAMKVPKGATLAEPNKP